MKLTKYLVFKLNDQKFAIRSKSVLNIIENVKLLNTPVKCAYHAGIFCFNGLLLPLVDLHTLLNISQTNTPINRCVLIVELIINNRPEIVGLSTDEVVEITDFDDLLSYPCTPVYNSKIIELREAIILYKNEPVILINANKVHSHHFVDNSGKQNIHVFSN